MKLSTEAKAVLAYALQQALRVKRLEDNGAPAAELRTAREQLKDHLVALQQEVPRKDRPKVADFLDDTAEDAAQLMEDIAAAAPKGGKKLVDAKNAYVAFMAPLINLSPAELNGVVSKIAEAALSDEA
ncbi:MAG TPA: hypothetical protein VFZ48_01625 [Candidatus Saccharimonadales bacterium]